MKNSGKPANPIFCDNGQVIARGLTKREAFAMAAMQGILSNRQYEPPRKNKLNGMAEDAVSAADALLKQLESKG